MLLRNRLQVSVGWAMDRFRPTKADTIIAGIGTLCCTALMVALPVTDRVEANPEARAGLEEQLADIDRAQTYLDGIYQAVRSPNEYRHIEGVDYDHTVYELPPSINSLQRLQAFNEEFQNRRQEDPLIGETLQQVATANTKQEAAGAIALTNSDLEDEQAVVKHNLTDLAELRSVENGWRDKRNGAIAGILALSVAAGVVARKKLPTRVRMRLQERRTRQEVAEGFEAMDRFLADMGAIG